MKPLLIRGSIIFVITIILSALLFFLPTPQKNNKETIKDSKGISSSLFVSGSNEKPVSYQSIDFSDTNNTNDLTEKVTLLEFLNISPSIQEDIVTNPIPKKEVSELKKYGNTVGIIINKYGNSPKNELLIFERFFAEPNNNVTISDLNTLGQAYISIGDEIRIIDAPKAILQFNDAFALAHKKVGEGMKTLIGNDFTPENISSYSDSIAPFVNAYLNLAQYLRASGVRFEEDEPGSLFTLPF